MKTNFCACYGSNQIHECYCNLKNNNMKQTAVEWIVEQLAPSVSLQQKYIDELLEQAKAMEKEQIEDAWKDGAYGGGQFTTTFDNEEQYYNETFKK